MTTGDTRIRRGGGGGGARRGRAAGGGRQGAAGGGGRGTLHGGAGVAGAGEGRLRRRPGGRPACTRRTHASFKPLSQACCRTRAAARRPCRLVGSACCYPTALRLSALKPRRRGPVHSRPWGQRQPRLAMPLSAAFMPRVVRRIACGNSPGWLLNVSEVAVAELTDASGR